MPDSNGNFEQSRMISSDGVENHPALTRLYPAVQVREMDRIIIHEYGVAGYLLMTRAGEGVFDLLRQHYPTARTVAVFCGGGNNAGDGYIVARLALQAGLEVQVYCVSATGKLQGDARQAYQDYTAADGECVDFDSTRAIRADVIVDALLGTGLDRPVGGLYAEAIDSINSLQVPAIAVDIPSGLNADTGAVMGHAVRADRTITFIGLKQGLFTGQAADYCGSIHFSSLAAPREIYRQQTCSVRLMQQPVYLPARSRCAHKGANGHVLVIGGEAGYTGAVRLAAEAAARTGAGLVSIASRPEHAGFLNLDRPELMCHGIATGEQLQNLLDWASVVAIGPGLGQSPWAESLLRQVLKSDKPLVVDADALNLLAQTVSTRENWVLTPHPGEAARLLQCSTTDINADRFAAVRSLQQKYHGICVLKGAGSLIADNDQIHVSTTGNPGMASGGMGDVLTGIIAGLIAQGMNLAEAARSGVFMHGLAADDASVQGERGLLARDLMPHLRKRVNSAI